ncbi:3-methyl-2-oxobutanoate hydroxymethyltransferase [bacterium]|nr:3-methyl-2-oxobutanoate hydroxymethyltransferase [bacterium]
MSTSALHREKISVPRLIAKKVRGEKIACLTAYDWTMARLLDEAGIDLILIGDSAAMVFAGQETTLTMTMDEMLYHTRVVSRGVKNALVITDMPFLSYQVNPDEAVRNAGRFLQQGGADGVKVEGGVHMVETIRRLTDIGIPVMGHLGLTPQSIRSFGNYRLRGKSSKEADQIFEAARKITEAGVFSMVLEKIPSELARRISEEVGVPTIGIGAGPHCDGQILVTNDMLGLFEDFKPKFVRRYANLAETIRSAAADYASDVRDGDYPSTEESF